MPEESPSPESPVYQSDPTDDQDSQTCAPADTVMSSIGAGDPAQGGAVQVVIAVGSGFDLPEFSQAW